MNSKLLLIGLLALTTTAAAHAEQTPLEKAKAAIFNFHEVTPGQIYRGALPSAAGFEALKLLGIKTDVSLILPGEMHGAIRQERERAAANGIRLYFRPMIGGIHKIDKAEVDNVLDLMADPANYPLYIHCKYGWDRTGMMVGLYRVFVQKLMNASDAWNEMRQHGFHPILVGLDCTYRELTGLSRSPICHLLPDYNPVLEE